MGNTSEEIEIQKEINKLENDEIDINLEIYKLQSELNKRLPKDRRKKLKKNYEENIKKWKLRKSPPKEYVKLNLDPYDMLEMDYNKNEQKEFNERKDEENKKNEKKTKDNYLDSGLLKLKKRVKELEKIDKENEKIDIRKNKETIKRDYMKQLKKIEKLKMDEDIKEEIVKNKNIDKLDEPDIYENQKNEKLSELYDNAKQNDNSEYEKIYLDELELYENILKDKDLKDKLEEVTIKRIEGKNGEYSDYEYEIKSNKEIEKAIENRNKIIKNGDIIKVDNSPYSEAGAGGLPALRRQLSVEHRPPGGRQRAAHRAGNIQRDRKVDKGVRPGLVQCAAGGGRRGKRQ